MQENKQTLKEYGRGVVGGLIFSLPLIYTMEMWWTGFIAQPHTLVICILITFLLLLGYNKYSGTRKGGTFKELCHESIEEVGLAFLTSFIFLLLISQINFGMSLMEILGKVVVESMVVAIGISVGTAELGQGNEEDQEAEHQKKNENSSNSVTNDDKNENEAKDGDLVSLLVLSICGAVLFASSVAPTEEILKIAATSTPVHLIFMLVAALLLSVVITYFSDFTGSRKEEIGFYEMILHTLIGFLAAIVSSFFLLWFFGRIEGNGHEIIIAQVIILAIPAIIGASAGRLIIKG